MNDSQKSVRARLGTPLAVLGLAFGLLREILGMFTDAKEFGELFPHALSCISAPWFGPLVFAVGIVLYLWAHHDWTHGKNFFDSLYADYGVKRPMTSLIIICLIGALVGAIAFGKTWKYIASRHTTTTEKPKVSSDIPHSEADAKASSPTPSPHAQDKQAKTEKKSALPPPVLDLQAGRHIEVNDSKIVAHEGSAV